MLRSGCHQVVPGTPTHADTLDQLKLDPATKERLQRLASARRRTPHWILREAVAQYVEREEKRETLRQDAQAAWAHYQATGLHVIAEEADVWLAKLEAGEDTTPSCHV